jgi:hypothetical protein
MSDDQPDREDETFRRLHEQLRSRLYRQEAPEALHTLLSAVSEGNRRAGFQGWDPDMRARRPLGDPGRQYPRLHPLTTDHPRLFISYSWSQDMNLRTDEADHWADAFAGFLFGRGYDIVYDRDPRNLDKGLSWFDLLVRMNDCNYFVLILTDELLNRLRSSTSGPAFAEWKHALKGYPDWYTFIGIWRSGTDLPQPFSSDNVVDVRSVSARAPWSKPISRVFPAAPPGAWGRPLLPPPLRPPDPPHWPAYVPYPDGGA